MPQERTAKKLHCLAPIGRKPRGRPKIRWQDYGVRDMKDLSWSRLGITLEHCFIVIPFVAFIMTCETQNMTCEQQHLYDYCTKQLFILW